jgi:hypothetical protein
MGDYSHGRDLHVDTVLSNAVVGRRPEGYVADQLVPILGVSKQSNIYYKVDHMVNRRYDPNLSARAPGTEARKVKFTVSSDTYFAKNYELGADWAVEDEVNADEVLQWATGHAELVTDRLLIDYEMRVAALANGATNLTSVATPWSNTTGSRPMDDLFDMAESFRTRTGVKPNVLLYPEEVGTKLRRNDQVRDMLYGDQGGIATDQQIAALLNIPKVLTPSLLINSTSIGQTLAGSGALVAGWAKKVWMFHVKPLAGFKTDTWVQGFRWTSPLLGTPWAVQRFPFDSKKKSYDLSVGYYQDEKIVSSDLALTVDSVI